MIEAHPQPLRPVLPLSDRMPTPLLTPLLTPQWNPLSIPFLPTFITDVGVISVDKKLRRSRDGVGRTQHRYGVCESKEECTSTMGEPRTT